MGAQFGFINFKSEEEMTAMKLDQGKARLDLIAPEAILAIGQVLEFGARKYKARNWEQGMEWGRFYGAALRHLNAWSAGEGNDPESGLPHLAHALCNIHFLLAYEQRHIGTDDRCVAILDDRPLIVADCGSKMCKDDPDLADDDDDEGAADPHERYEVYLKRRLAELA